MWGEPREGASLLPCQKSRESRLLPGGGERNRQCLLSVRLESFESPGKPQSSVVHRRAKARARERERARMCLERRPRCPCDPCSGSQGPCSLQSGGGGAGGGAREEEAPAPYKIWVAMEGRGGGFLLREAWFPSTCKVGRKCVFRHQERRVTYKLYALSLSLFLSRSLSLSLTLARALSLSHAINVVGSSRPIRRKIRSFSCRFCSCSCSCSCSSYSCSSRGGGSRG